jgi:hypothetical protein
MLAGVSGCSNSCGRVPMDHDLWCSRLIERTSIRRIRYKLVNAITPGG